MNIAPMLFDALLSIVTFVLAVFFAIAGFLECLGNPPEK